MPTATCPQCRSDVDVVTERAFDPEQQDVVERKVFAAHGDDDTVRCPGGLTPAPDTQEPQP